MYGAYGFNWSTFNGMGCHTCASKKQNINDQTTRIRRNINRKITSSDNTTSHMYSGDTRPG
jgi:hypothetical protein